MYELKIPTQMLRAHSQGLVRRAHTNTYRYVSMGKQKRVNLTIDKEVIKKAKEMGLNLSKIAENAFKEAIEALESRRRPTKTNGGCIDSRKAVSSATMVLRPGFEPGSAAFSILF
jgi:post-segregation antitoxin (ccd killing protein)